MPHTPLDPQTCLSLCKSLEKLQASWVADYRPTTVELESVVEAGWTPYLHDFLSTHARVSLTSSSRLFVKREVHAPFFETLLTQFPLMALHFPLIETGAYDRGDFDNPRLLETAKTHWLYLGSLQKNTLLRLDKGAALAHPATAKGVPLWLKCLAQAILPGSPTATSSQADSFSFPGAPFYGYFDSPAWDSLRSTQPRWAHALSVSLYLHCALHLHEGGVAAAQPWMELALLHAKSLAGPLTHEAGIGIAHLCHATAVQFLSKDKVQPLMALIDILGINVAANETEFFGSLGRSGAVPALLGRIESSENALRGIRPATGRVFIAPIDLTKRDYGHNQNFTPIERLPLLSLSALHQSHGCWNALSARFGEPHELTTPVTHFMKLSSPIEISQRLARHTENARATNSTEIERLTQNLERASQRAAASAKRLPLPDDLFALLMGPEATRSGEPFEIPPEAQPLFDKECGRAVARIHKGQQASIHLPVFFDWTAHLLALGAAPSFLSTKLPVGMLSRSARLFDMTTHGMQKSRFRPEEMAFIERDELLKTSSSEPTVAKVRPRL